MPRSPGKSVPVDRDIVELLTAGASELAFEQLLDRYQAKVYRLCCALLRDPTRAQDAAQESLVRIWKALPSYDGRASISTWIYAITRNRCLTAMAQYRKQEGLTEPELDTEFQDLSAETCGADSQAQLLRSLVDRLPENHRSTLMLYYFEERSVKDVAVMLSMSDAAVKTALFRARAALMDRLRRLGVDTPSFWLEVN